jgi:hypothetical protein
VKHRRLIELDKKARRVLVEDTLEMEEDHLVELFFHCSERCSVEPVAGGFALTQDERTVTLFLPQAENASARVYCGSMSPMLGWRSRAFDRRVPAPSIVWQARLVGRAVLRTEIAVPALR